MDASSMTLLPSAASGSTVIQNISIPQNSSLRTLSLCQYRNKNDGLNGAVTAGNSSKLICNSYNAAALPSSTYASGTGSRSSKGVGSSYGGSQLHSAANTSNAPGHKIGRFNLVGPCSSTSKSNNSMVFRTQRRHSHSTSALAISENMHGTNRKPNTPREASLGRGEVKSKPTRIANVRQATLASRASTHSVNSSLTSGRGTQQVQQQRDLIERKNVAGLLHRSSSLVDLRRPNPRTKVMAGYKQTVSCVGAGAGQPTGSKLSTSALPISMHERSDFGALATGPDLCTGRNLGSRSRLERSSSVAYHTQQLKKLRQRLLHQQQQKAASTMIHQQVVAGATAAPAAKSASLTARLKRSLSAAALSTSATPYMKSNVGKSTLQPESQLYQQPSQQNQREQKQQLCLDRTRLETERYKAPAGSSTSVNYSHWDSRSTCRKSHCCNTFSGMAQKAAGKKVSSIDRDSIASNSSRIRTPIRVSCSPDPNRFRKTTSISVHSKTPQPEQLQQQHHSEHTYLLPQQHRTAVLRQRPVLQQFEKLSSLPQGNSPEVFVHRLVTLRRRNPLPYNEADNVSEPVISESKGAFEADTLPCSNIRHTASTASASLLSLDTGTAASGASLNSSEPIPQADTLFPAALLSAVGRHELLRNKVIDPSPSRSETNISAAALGSKGPRSYCVGTDKGSDKPATQPGAGIDYARASIQHSYSCCPVAELGASAEVPYEEFSAHSPAAAAAAAASVYTNVRDSRLKKTKVTYNHNSWHHVAHLAGRFEAPKQQQPPPPALQQLKQQHHSIRRSAPGVIKQSTKDGELRDRQLTIETAAATNPNSLTVEIAAADSEIPGGRQHTEEVAERTPSNFRNSITLYSSNSKNNTLELPHTSSTSARNVIESPRSSNGFEKEENGSSGNTNISEKNHLAAELSLFEECESISSSTVVRNMHSNCSSSNTGIASKQGIDTLSSGNIDTTLIRRLHTHSFDRWCNHLKMNAARYRKGMLPLRGIERMQQHNQQQQLLVLQQLQQNLQQQAEQQQAEQEQQPLRKTASLYPQQSPNAERKLKIHSSKVTTKHDFHEACLSRNIHIIKTQDTETSCTTPANTRAHCSKEALQSAPFVINSEDSNAGEKRATSTFAGENPRSSLSSHRSASARSTSSYSYSSRNPATEASATAATAAAAAATDGLGCSATGSPCINEEQVRATSARYTLTQAGESAHSLPLHRDHTTHSVATAPSCEAAATCAACISPFDLAGNCAAAAVSPALKVCVSVIHPGIGSNVFVCQQQKSMLQLVEKLKQHLRWKPLLQHSIKQLLSELLSAVAESIGCTCCGCNIPSSNSFSDPLPSSPLPELPQHNHLLQRHQQQRQVQQPQFLPQQHVGHQQDKSQHLQRQHHWRRRWKAILLFIQSLYDAVFLHETPEQQRYSEAAAAAASILEDCCCVGDEQLSILYKENETQPSREHLQLSAKRDSHCSHMQQQKKGGKKCVSQLAADALSPRTAAETESLTIKHSAPMVQSVIGHTLPGTEVKDFSHDSKHRPQQHERQRQRLRQFKAQPTSGVRTAGARAQPSAVSIQTLQQQQSQTQYQKRRQRLQQESLQRQDQAEREHEQAQQQHSQTQFQETKRRQQHQPQMRQEYCKEYPNIENTQTDDVRACDSDVTSSKSIIRSRIPDKASSSRVTCECAVEAIAEDPTGADFEVNDLSRNPSTTRWNKLPVKTLNQTTFSPKAPIAIATPLRKRNSCDSLIDATKGSSTASHEGGSSNRGSVDRCSGLYCSLQTLTVPESKDAEIHNNLSRFSQNSIRNCGRYASGQNHEERIRYNLHSASRDCIHSSISSWGDNKREGSRSGSSSSSDEKESKGSANPVADARSDRPSASTEIDDALRNPHHDALSLLELALNQQQQQQQQLTDLPLHSEQQILVAYQPHLLILQQNQPADIQTVDSCLLASGAADTLVTSAAPITWGEDIVPQRRKKHRTSSGAVLKSHSSPQTAPERLWQMHLRRREQRSRPSSREEKADESSSRPSSAW